MFRGRVIGSGCCRLAGPGGEEQRACSGSGPPPPPTACEDSRGAGPRLSGLWFLKDSTLKDPLVFLEVKRWLLPLFFR